MAWMRELVESWLCKKSFSPAPEEEFRKVMMEGACNVMKGIKESPAGEACFPTIGKGGLGRLVRVYGSVVAAIYKWRKKTGAQGPVIINPIKDGMWRVGYPSAECRRAGELYLLKLAQKGMGIQSKDVGHKHSNRGRYAWAEEKAHHGGFESQEPDCRGIREGGVACVAKATPSGCIVHAGRPRKRSRRYTHNTP
jgi:hypothetical protein